MHARVQMRDRVMGDADMSRYYATFKALTGECRSPGTSDFAHRAFTVSENQIPQDVLSKLHRSVSTEMRCSIGSSAIGISPVTQEPPSPLSRRRVGASLDLSRAAISPNGFPIRKRALRKRTSWQEMKSMAGRGTDSGFAAEPVAENQGFLATAGHGLLGTGQGRDSVPFREVGQSQAVLDASNRA